MAIVKKRQMNRPNNLTELFEHLDLTLENQDIVGADDLINRMDNVSFPIDLNCILAQLNLRLIRDELPDDISGVLNLENRTIIVEKRHTAERQNFTIAHEIAHFCLHQNQNNIFEDKIFFRGIANNSLEYQANEFAGELLMPRDEFLNQIRNGNRTITGLARTFGVSTLAVRVRADRLGLRVYGS